MDTVKIIAFLLMVSSAAYAALGMVFGYEVKAFIALISFILGLILFLTAVVWKYYYIRKKEKMLHRPGMESIRAVVIQKK